MMITNKHTNRTANIDYYVLCAFCAVPRVCTQHEWRLKRIPKEQPAAMQFSAINGGQKMHFTDGIARLEGKKEEETMASGVDIKQWNAQKWTQREYR